MKIALASEPVVTGDIRKNIFHIIQLIERLSGTADLIVFGETALQGFDCLTWDYEKDLYMAISQDNMQIIQICSAAKKNRIAVSFGYIEYYDDALFSSQLVIDADGFIVHNFRRVSNGWKEYWHTDEHYREGTSFETFRLGDKSFAIGLCGDLWAEDRPQEMKALNADIVLWPVWCDYNADDWNNRLKFEYAQQAKKCGDIVLCVNPFCADSKVNDSAAGGAVCFKEGKITDELPAGKIGVLVVDL